VSRSTSATRTPSLSETLAPPTIATKGRPGASMSLDSACSSLWSSRPAALSPSRSGTPTTEAWARWHAPKASLTYASPSAARASPSLGSFFVSPASQRKFSSKTIWPGRRSETSLVTPSPTTSSGRRTSASSSSASRWPTGSIDRAGTRLPLGRPRWLATISLAPRCRSAFSVGTAARMRVSSRTAGDSSSLAGLVSGTLKSTRTNTRRLSTSSWSMVDGAPTADTSHQYPRHRRRERASFAGGSWGVAGYCAARASSEARRRSSCTSWMSSVDRPMICSCE